VTISDATSGSTIYYTTNGTTPTASSNPYSGAVTVSSTETIEAIAVAAGYANSAVATAAYIISTPTTAATPVISPAAGTYTSAQSVTIKDATAGAAIYYTTNGTTPTANSTLYSGAITVASTETLEAIAVAPGDSNSPVASATYTISLPSPNFSVAVSPAALTVAEGQSGTVTVSVSPQNAFSSAVSFSCSGLPADATCSFSPTTVTPSGAAASSATLTISTSAKLTAAQRGKRSVFPGSMLAIAFCLLAWRKRPPLHILSLLMICAVGLSLLSGCVKKASSQNQPTTSTVTVTASSGSLQNSATFSLTVN